MVGRRHGDEQDVQHERRAAHLLVEHHGADGQRAEHVPDGDHRGDVDLLRRMARAPPEQAVDLGIGHRGPPHRPHERGDVHHGAVHQRDDGDDRRRHGAVDDERERAGVGLLALGDHQRREELPGDAERADGEEDDAEVEERVGLERRVRGEQHVGASAPLRPLDDGRPDHHQPGS